MIRRSRLAMLAVLERLLSVALVSARANRCRVYERDIGAREAAVRSITRE
jgi:hypothetical protein